MSYVKFKAIIFTFLSSLYLFSGTSLFASSECLTDRLHFKTNNPSDLDIKFCSSDLAKLSKNELHKLADKNDGVQGTDENFGIQYNVISELEDWILVNLKENETEYNFREIVGFNCNTQNFEELKTNSITGSGEWTPSFSQYAVVLNAVCGFEGNFVDTLKSFSNYCYLTYNVPWCYLGVSSAKYRLALIIGKKIQKENPQLSVWGIEFFDSFNTTGCDECGSNMPEVLGNNSTLSSDLLQFMEEQYNILFKSNPTVTIDDLRNLNQSDYENLSSVIDRY